MITAKEIFTIKLQGDPIRLEYLISKHRAEWPATIELFYEQKIFKKVENGAEVMYAVHITLPDPSHPSGRRLLELKPGQQLLEYTGQAKVHETWKNT